MNVSFIFCVYFLEINYDFINDKRSSNPWSLSVPLDLVIQKTNQNTSIPPCRKFATKKPSAVGSQVKNQSCNKVITFRLKILVLSEF